MASACSTFRGSSSSSEPPLPTGILSINHDNIVGAINRYSQERDAFLDEIYQITNVFRGQIGLPQIPMPKREQSSEGNRTIVQSAVKRGRKRRGREEDKRVVLNPNRFMAPTPTVVKTKKARSDKTSKRDPENYVELMTELTIEDKSGDMMASKSSFDKARQKGDTTVANDTVVSNTRSTRARTRAAANASRINATQMNTPSRTAPNKTATSTKKNTANETPRSRTAKMVTSATKQAIKTSKENLTASVTKAKQNTTTTTGKQTVAQSKNNSAMNATPSKTIIKTNITNNNTANVLNNTPSKVAPATPRRKAEMDAKFKEKLIMSEDKTRKAIEKKEQLLSNRQQTLRERAACRQRKLEEFQKKQKEEQQQKMESMQKKMQTTPTRAPRRGRVKKDEEPMQITPSKPFKTTSNDSLSKTKPTAVSRKEQSNSKLNGTGGAKKACNLARSESSGKLNNTGPKVGSTLNRNDSCSKLKVTKDGDSSIGNKSNGPKKPPRAGNSKKNLKEETHFKPLPSPVALSPIAKATDLPNSTFVASDHESGKITKSVEPNNLLNSTFPVPPTKPSDHVFQVPPVPPMTPKNPNLSRLEQSINSYQMTPPRRDVESQYDLTQAFDSEDEEAAEAAERARGCKKIPSWAQGKNFIQLVRAQFSKPAAELDKIALAAFGEIRLPVPLEEMGLSVKDKYAKRSSSVYWDTDKLQNWPA